MDARGELCRVQEQVKPNGLVFANTFTDWKLAWAV